MNTLNHVGLTLAVALPAEYLIRRTVTSSRRRGLSKGLALAGVPLAAADRISPAIFFDFRLVVIGSIIPDILDKPLGFFLIPELLNGNLRTIGHGGLFALAFLLVGLAANFAIRNPQILVMAAASAAHLVLDKMWLQRDTLLWPIFGLQFPQGTTSLSEYMWFHLRALMSPQPLDFVTAGIVLALAAYVVVSSGVLVFFKHGRVLPVRPE